MLKVGNEKIIVLSVVSYVGPLLDSRMSVAKNKVLRKIFVHKKDEVSEQFILHNAFYALICYVWTAGNCLSGM